MAHDHDARRLALANRTEIHTITFRYPREFLTAMAKVAGRKEEWPSPITKAETEVFIREAIQANIQAILDEFRPKPKTKSKLFAKVRRT